MPKPTAQQIRQQFIDFFVEKCGHTFVPSSPCVPIDDPTLMFTNAGMNQFKPIFLGTADPKSEFGRLKRAVNSQKCIRAGGKHNDLDDVGHDTYHHTFFEMLGNWSFGDYFKREAIAWAWELLTKVWGIEKGRLHATYFGGDEKQGLEPDNEARDLWLNLTDIDPAHVHPGNMKDNFWEMGDTGPCGPCSEIHIDLTPDKSGRELVNAGDPRVMEIWNLVFIQFNRATGGALSPLPAKHVDTGMGLERVTSVLQGMAAGRLGKFSNYDADLFTPIFKSLQKITNAGEYEGLLESIVGSAVRTSARNEIPSANTAASETVRTADPTSAVMRDVAYRVIADHIRTLTFAITDGALPSNEGRGFVLRRILRRAVRYGRQYLNVQEPFLCKLVPTVIEVMGAAFPELRSAHGGKNADHVAEVLRDEEQSFIKTLDRGIALFDEAAQYAVTHHHGRIKGEDAFKLHDTYGFPIDLTELMAEERGLTVDIGEYERLMEEARERSRIQRISQFLGIPEEQLANPTEDEHKYEFPTKPIKATYLFPLAIGQSFGGFVFDKTPFYGEQGGQVGDIGEIEFPQGTIRISSTIRDRNQVVHVYPRKELDNLNDKLTKGQAAILHVNNQNRQLIMQNHTSTHILNWALREVLGDHVQQKGSLVDPDKTRFDFSHPKPVGDEELARIEKLTNQTIEKDLPVYDKIVPQNDALKIHGLRAVFGEKYPENVRVVSIGRDVDELLKNPDNAEWRNYSVEFCGGTHLKKTAEAKHFRLIEESAVAKGIRRVTGVSGEKALEVERNAARLRNKFDEAERSDDAALGERVTELTSALNCTELPVLDKGKLRERLAALQERAKKFQKEQSKAGAADVKQQAETLLKHAERVGDTAIVCGDLGEAGVEQLRVAVDSLRDKAGSAAVFLAARQDGKVVLLAAITRDLIEKGVKAGDLIKAIAPTVGGRGGGKPDLAQGGGTEPGKIPDAVQDAVKWLRATLNP